MGNRGSAIATKVGIVCNKYRAEVFLVCCLNAESCVSLLQVV